MNWRGHRTVRLVLGGTMLLAFALACREEELIGAGPYYLTIGRNPSWHPSEDLIAYDNGTMVFICRALDGRIMEVVEGPGDRAVEPDWAPDGVNIVYHADGENIEPGLFISPYTGGTPTRLTTGRHYSPSWSPDGENIAFIDYDNDDHSLWLVATGGGEPRRVGNVGRWVGEPDWSSDGELIIFSWMGKAPNSGGIWQIKPDGTSLHFLVPTGNSLPVAWSPGGNYIACDYRAELGQEIHVYDLKNKTFIQVTDDWRDGANYEPKNPTWNAEGTAIAYKSYRNPPGIYRVDL